MLKKGFLIACVAGTLVAVSSALAGTSTPVAFSVLSTFGGAESIVTGTSDIPGCAAADVTTEGDAAFPGRVGLFEGQKIFGCAAGTLIVGYRAHVVGCSETDTGTWWVIAGTGLYAGATGGGKLEGTYLPDDSCNAYGIEDHYTGTLKLTQ